jgi:hypothetical protein
MMKEGTIMKNILLRSGASCDSADLTGAPRRSVAVFSLIVSAIVPLGIFSGVQAQPSASETQIRLSAGSAAEGGAAWGLRLSRVLDWQGGAAELSGGSSSDPLNFKLSWNLMSEESASPEVMRLGFGISRNESKQHRIAFAFSQETDGLGWSAGAMHGIGKAAVFRSVPTFVNEQVLPPQVIPGYDIFSRPWRYGALGRALYNDNSTGFRLTAGADVEWENSASRQITASVLAEKYFGRTPLSVAFGWEHAWLPKDSPNGKATDRFTFNIRYEFTRNSASGFEPLNRRSEDSMERASLRETFFLKTMDNGYYRKNK